MFVQHLISVETSGHWCKSHNRNKCETKTTYLKWNLTGSGFVFSGLSPGLQFSGEHSGKRLSVNTLCWKIRGVKQTTPTLVPWHGATLACWITGMARGEVARHRMAVSGKRTSKGWHCPISPLAILLVQSWSHCHSHCWPSHRSFLMPQSGATTAIAASSCSMPNMAHKEPCSPDMAHGTRQVWHSWCKEFHSRISSFSLHPREIWQSSPGSRPHRQLPDGFPIILCFIWLDEC